MRSATPPAFLSALAAIILTAVGGLFDVQEARRLWKTSRPDAALMGLTFVATLSLGVELGSSFNFKTKKRQCIQRRKQ